MAERAMKDRVAEALSAILKVDCVSGLTGVTWSEGKDVARFTAYLGSNRYIDADLEVINEVLRYSVGSMVGYEIHQLKHANHTDGILSKQCLITIWDSSR